MLVVVAIIAILAALLLPALSRAKAGGQFAKCKSNLRQMGVALWMYVDNGRQYPYYAAYRTEIKTWQMALDPTLCRAGGRTDRSVARRTKV